MYNLGRINVLLFEKIDDIKQFLASKTAAEKKRIIFAYRDKADGPWYGVNHLTVKDIDLLDKNFSQMLVATAWYCERET